MKDKNGQTIKLKNMVQFKEDGYTFALGIVKNISPQRIQITVCGGGGRGNRLLSSENVEKNVEVINIIDD